MSPSAYLEGADSLFLAIPENEALLIRMSWAWIRKFGPTKWVNPSM
jgi:hypothetical protein